MSLIGLHQFTAYEGDQEYVQNEYTGLWEVSNPVVYASPVYKNLILDTGRTSLLDALSRGLGTIATPAAFGHIGVGTDSTAAAASQTKLNPSVTGSAYIQACDSGFPTRSGLTTTYRATFGTGVANFVWNEAGIFNGTVNATSTMFNRVIIGPFSKTSAVSITYTTGLTQG